MSSFETVQNLFAPVGGVADALLYLGLLVVAGVVVAELLKRRRAQHNDESSRER